MPRYRLEDLKKQVIIELIKRKTLKNINLYSDLFDKQLDVAEDPSKRISICCSRRAGKTVLLARLLGQTALQYPTDRSVYIASTIKQAKELLSDEIDTINLEHKTNFELKQQDNTIITPAQHKIHIAGADNERSIKRLLGKKYRLAVIDEAQDLQADVLQMLIDKVLSPALDDYEAPLVLAGTPGRICAGPFYESAAGAANWYSRHHWTRQDNPMYPLWRGKSNWKQLALEFLEKQRIREGRSVDDPDYRRERYGEWINDADQLVYLLNPNSYITSMPPHETLRKVLGIDLGYRDAAAYVIAGYDQHTQKCYHVASESKNELPLLELLAYADKMRELWQPERIVVDWSAGGHNLIAELQRRYGIPVSAAKKSEKATAMRMLRSELMTAHTQIQKDSKLEKEIKFLEWNKAYTRERETKTTSCDEHDAFLYAWRECKHWYHVEKLKKLSEQELIEQAIDSETYNSFDDY